ncbi:tetratricopeptide repeat protein [Rhodopirellula sp. P2]|uniref:tetratricopeptide repeat protein n=1 Tax=Rhodopirellula sp. P2 TaxID=2127060 RepID=UPI00236793FE|nr:tetratricopeptide repeat protein [Rhodopirellula sp. P2]WDQ17617.1 tetratricopeptide repeat protein [Rhodopirellula sp. P2]
MSKRSARTTKRNERSKSGSVDLPLKDSPESSPQSQAWTSSSSDAVWWILVAAACAVGLVLRLWHFAAAAQLPTSGELLGDALGYFQWSQEIASGDWFGQETFYQAPLYPYFLAVVSVLFGPSVTMMQMVQCLLDVASVAMLAVATRNWFGRRAGWLAAFGYAMYPPAIYYCLLIQKAGLATFLLALFLMLASRLHPHQSRSFQLTHSVGLGFVLGLLVLTRENALLWIPLIPIWLFIAMRRPPELDNENTDGPQLNPPDQPTPPRWPLTLAYFFGLAVVLLPVAARNASLGGEWSPTTFQSGPNFYIGNSADANGIYVALVPGHETPEYERSDAQKLAEEATGRELTPREVSKFWFRRAWSDIRHSPTRWIRLMALKTAMVVNRYEVPDVESYSLHRAVSTPLRWLGAVWHFGILFPLAIVGFATTAWKPRSIGLLLVLALSMIGAVAMFFILGRYRFPLVPLLLPVAAIGVWNLGWMVCNREFQRWTVITVALLAIVLANFPLHQEQSLNANALANAGAAAGQAGKFEISIEWLEKAIALEPDSPVPHYNLAGAYLMTNQVEAAIEQLLIAKRLDPDLVEVDRTLASLFEQRGELDRASHHYREAVRVDPMDQSSLEAIRRLTAPNQSPGGGVL